MGDVIAFALGVRRADGLHVNALAYLRGDPDWPGTSAITLGDLEAVAALPQTATDNGPGATLATPGDAGWRSVLPIGAALTAFVAVLARLHRTTPKPNGPSMQGPD
jgi:hypothetical protein